jgi:hypothetical protein
VAALAQQFTAANLRRPGKLFGAARDLVQLVDQGHGPEVCRQTAILVVLGRMTGSGYAADCQQAALGEGGQTSSVSECWRVSHCQEG